MKALDDAVDDVVAAGDDVVEGALGPLLVPNGVQLVPVAGELDGGVMPQRSSTTCLMVLSWRRLMRDRSGKRK